MALYARSDISSVGISADGHGGCGQAHSRPVTNGAPARVWMLECVLCEQHLRHDPLWSTTLSEIPETHDERLAREDFDKRGAMDKDALMAAALARLTGLELPDTLAAKMSGVRPSITAGAVLCPAGHVNRAGAKFCTECGSPVPVAGGPSRCPDGHENEAAAKFCVDCGKPTRTSQPAADTSRETAQPAPVGSPQNAPPPRNPPKMTLPSNTKMRGMKLPELAALAALAGVDGTGTRADVLARLVEAGNAAKVTA